MDLLVQVHDPKSCGGHWGCMPLPLAGDLYAEVPHARPKGMLCSNNDIGSLIIPCSPLVLFRKFDLICREMHYLHYTILERFLIILIDF